MSQDSQYKEECTRLMLLAAHRADMHDDSGYLDLYTDDLVIDRNGKKMRGRAELAEMLKGRSRDRITRHVMSPPIIEKQPNGDVTGVSYYTLYEAQRQEAAEPPYPLRVPSAVGEYRQKYVYTSNGWRISELKIISVFKNKA